MAIFNIVEQNDEFSSVDSQITSASGVGSTLEGCLFVLGLSAVWKMTFK